MHPQRWQVITAGICALILTVGLARFSYTPMLPIMKAQAGLSALDGGLLATLNYLGYMSGALLASTLSKLQHKFVMYRIGLVTALITTLAMGLTQDVALWLLLRYVSGLSSVAGLLIASGLVMNWLNFHHHRTELGLHFAGMGLGIALTGLLVLGMNPALAWDAQWWVMGAGGILFLVPAWLWMPPPPVAVTSSPTTAASNSGASSKATAQAAQPRSDTAHATPQGWLRQMALIYFCGGFGYVISATFIVAIVAEKLPANSAGGPWVWVVVGLAAVPSTFVWDRVARKLGDVGALQMAYLVQGVSVALPLLSTHLAAGVASAALYGGTFVGIVSLTLSMVGRRQPSNPAKAMARITLSYGAAQVIAPAIAGHVAQLSGSYRGSLWMALALTGLAWVLLGRLRHSV